MNGASSKVTRTGLRSPGGTTLWTILLIIATLVWGNSFIAIKHIIARVTPLELVTVRFVPVTLTFAALLLPTRGRQVWRMIRADGWRLALLGLLIGASILVGGVWLINRQQTTGRRGDEATGGEEEFTQYATRDT